MIKVVIKTIIQAAVIVGVAASIAIVTNMVRKDGIPLVTDIPYEIFAPCKDSDATSENVTADELLKSGENVLYVDARPKEIFDKEHVKDAINVPYSALFGAAKEDVDRVAKEAKKRGVKSVIVYGAYEDPASPGDKVDFGKPLAEQLLEAKVEGVRHVEGGLEVLNSKGIKTVKTNGGSK
jgi:spore germination protein YaaH